jgi:hypothetical protein
VKENQQTHHVMWSVRQWKTQSPASNIFFSPFARFQILCRGFRAKDIIRGSGHMDLLFTSISTTRLPFGNTRWSRGVAFYSNAGWGRQGRRSISCGPGGPQLDLQPEESGGVEEYCSSLLQCWMGRQGRRSVSCGPEGPQVPLDLQPEESGQ